MNRIEEKMEALKKENKKAMITYLTAGLPDLETTKKLIIAQEQAGTDVVEIGVPFSDPIADGPVIQEASFEAIQNGVNTNKIFTAVEELRQAGARIPIVLMLYANTICHYGVDAFTERCSKAGVDGLIVPDLPMEEQSTLQNALDRKNTTILIQLVSPVSGQRIPKILKNARGFVYCVSSMGVTGQAAGFHKKVIQYLKEVKQVSKIPVMMGFGIRTPEDVEPMKDIIDGAIVGSHFIQLMRESNYSEAVAAEYCSSFKAKMNA